ncbi:MAG: T9SS type A sorting domain-containing protein [Flavobacteriales bacterium]
MRTPLLLTFATFSCFGTQVGAQDIPTDVIGDTGWILYGFDTFALVRAADGNVWLQQNLGSSDVATAHNDAAGFGDRYQWGRWDDGHALPTSNTQPAGFLPENNPGGLGGGSDLFYLGGDPLGWWGDGSASDTWQGTTVSTSNGIDPCAALGGAWHLPTQADWVSILAAEGITNTTTAFTSNLKLTAAGARDGQTGTVINAGLYGQYWSSTPSTVYAKDLTVGDTWVNASDDALRGYGMCVRCLNNFLHVGLQEQRPDHGPAISPNPSSGTFAVNNGAVVINSITVYTADMRAIQTLAPMATSTAVVLDRLPEGVYWIELRSAEDTSWRKVVVQR